jgi:exosortase A
MRQFLLRSILLSAFAARRGVRRRTRTVEGPSELAAGEATKSEARRALESISAALPVQPAVVTTAARSARRLSNQAAAICAVALFACGVLALYWNTAASIVAIWLRSETFTHGFVVVPIALWLVWRRRDALAQIPAKPWWPALAGVAAAGVLWLVASAADTLGVKQFALVFMIQAGIVTIVGRNLARALVFPLAFLVFLVPAGEIFVPTLIDWTADFTVSALRWSGVPVYREANHFIIPSGAWSVVEACSGIRYIIASVMVGTIYAAIAYRSAGRRIAFLAASILVPIVANWLRAYMIVMLAHLTNNKLAVGVDHIIYGWVFFGVVMLLLFWVGSFWQQGDTVPRAPAPTPLKAIGTAGTRRPFAAAMLAMAIAALWPPVDAVVARPVTADAPALNALAGAGGWVPVPGASATWKPHYSGYASYLSQTFRKDDRTVELYLAFFRNQEKGRELITSGNLLVTKQEFSWRQLTTSYDNVDWAGGRAEAYRAEIAGPGSRLEAYRLYWINGTVTSSDYVAKALTAWSKLRGHGDDSALIVVYTPAAQSKGLSEALRDFVAAMSPSIERSLEAARGVPR